jgi:hypothetical protein
MIIGAQYSRDDPKSLTRAIQIFFLIQSTKELYLLLKENKANEDLAVEDDFFATIESCLHSVLSLSQTEEILDSSLKRENWDSNVVAYYQLYTEFKKGEKITKVHETHERIANTLMPQTTFVLSNNSSTLFIHPNPLTSHSTNTTSMQISEKGPRPQ